MKIRKKLISVLMCMILLAGLMPTEFASDIPKIEILTEVRVDGVTPPIAGAVVAISPKELFCSKHVGVMDARWFDATTNPLLKPNNVFQEGHEYKIIIDVVTDKGHQFPRDPSDLAAFINRKKATIGRYSVISVTLSLAFPKIPVVKPNPPIPPYTPENPGDTTIIPDTNTIPQS